MAKAKKSIRKVDYKANAKVDVRNKIKAYFTQQGHDVYDMGEEGKRLEGFTKDTLIVRGITVTDEKEAEHQIDVQIKLITPSANTGDTYPLDDDDEEEGAE